MSETGWIWLCESALLDRTSRAGGYTQHVPQASFTSTRNGESQQQTQPCAPAGDHGERPREGSEHHPASRKRKRRVSRGERGQTAEWQQRQRRQAEAMDRHDGHRDRLAMALAFLAQHTARLQPNGDSAAAGTPAPAGSEQLGALALAEQQLHQPQFAWRDDEPDGRQPLLDCLICNEQQQEQRAIANGVPIMVPACSSFIISDIKQIKHVLLGAVSSKFDCIVLDPPWENASAQRKTGPLAYPTLPSRNLKAIPISALTHQGSLVAIWVTNRERHLRFLEQELLPFWQLSHVATWLWLKVTPDGQPVTPLDAMHRRPYEQLLLCRPEGSAQELPVPNELVLISVPGPHSRKPKLDGLLQQCLPAGAHCLEMFARELTAGWTSWGNEPLLFQARCPYDEQPQQTEQSTCAAPV